MFHLFIVCPGFYMVSSTKTSLGSIIKFIAFLWYMGKYLFKKVSVLKAAGVVFPNVEKWGPYPSFQPRNHR